MVAAPAQTRIQVCRAWSQTFRPRVSNEFLEAAQEAFPGVFFQAYHPGADEINPHELLAIGRIIAEVHAIAHLAGLYPDDKVEPQEIDFLWGSNREYMLVRSLNTALERAGKAPIVPNVIGEQVVAEDQHRRPILPEGMHAKYGLMVNVYAVGLASQEVTPAWVSTLGYDALIWVGHPFNNLYGKLATAYWIRSVQQVEWYPDTINALYPPHGPCDSMHSAGALSIMQWHVMRTHTIVDGGVAKPLYDAVLFSPRVSRESEVHATRASEHMIFELDIPDVSQQLNWIRLYIPTPLQGAAIAALDNWLAWGIGSLSKTHVILHKADFSMAVRFLTNKGRQQYSFRGLQTEIDRVLSNPRERPDFCYLEQRLPERFLHYRWHLAIAAFVFDARSQAMTVEAVQRNYGPVFHASNAAVRGIDMPLIASGVSNWPIVLGLCGFAHLCLVRAPILGRPYRALVKTTSELVTRVLCVNFSFAHFWVRRVEVVAAQPTPVAVVPVKPPPPPPGPGLGDLAWQVADLAVEATSVGVRVTQDVVCDPNPVNGLPLYSTVIFAPLVEEGLKLLAHRCGGNRGWWLSCAALGFLDVVGNANPHVARDPLDFVAALIRAVGQHAFFGYFRYPIAVLLHGANNLVLHLVWKQIVAEARRPLVLIGTQSTSLPWGIGAVCVVATMAYWLLRRTRTTVDPVVAFDRLWYTDRSGPDAQAQPFPLLALDERRMIVQIPEGHEYVPPASVGPLAKPKLDKTVKIVPAEGRLMGPQGTVGGGYYRIWGHNAPMFRPAGSVENMEAVVYYRLGAQIAHEAQVGAWWEVHQLFAGGCSNLRAASWPIWRRGAETPTLVRIMPEELEMLLLDDPERWTEWLAHIDRDKVERAKFAHEVVLTSPLSVTSSKVRNVQVNVKKDEVLLKYRVVDSDNGMIPRPIHNVDPQLAVTVGPDVYATSKVIKTAWRWDNPMMGVLLSCGRDCFLQTHVKLTLTYGAGLSSADLDAWFAYATTHNGWHILVAGDDSLAVYSFDGVVVFVEGDISKCDHSVRALALAFEYAVLRSAGCSPRTIEFLSANSTATCVAGTRMADGGSVRVQRGPERNTGGVDTTVGNTIVTGGGLLRCCAKCEVDFSDRELTDRIAAHFRGGMAELGLDLKSRVWTGRLADLGTTLWPPSFLKGYWYPTPEGWSWGPLPSRLLKISKIMTDPRRVYWLPKQPKPSHSQAARRHVAALYAGLKPYAWPPVLLDWLRVRADPAWLTPVPIEEWAGDWRPSGHSFTSAPVPDERWIAQAAAWYRVDAEVVEDFLAHLMSLDTGGFSFHPFWVKMALRDYN